MCPPPPKKDAICGDSSISKVTSVFFDLLFMIYVIFEVIKALTSTTEKKLRKRTFVT